MANILVVDDEPAVRNLIAGWLRAADMNVAEAATGAEAILLARQTVYDVVIMDVMLPDMTGFAATEDIRARAGYRSLPVIGLTGLDMRIDVAHEGGFSDVLLKPIDRATLVGTVERNLASRAKFETKKRTASGRDRKQGR